MIKTIVKDVIFLGQQSETATPQDVSVAEDLLDTLKAHSDGCVGMAANMIGVKKRVIVVQNGDNYIVMFNPEIIKYSDIQLIKNYIYIILYYRHQDLKQQNNYIVCINLTFQLNLFLLKMK